MLVVSCYLYINKADTTYMTSEEYIKLYQKFIDGKCNAEEIKRLFNHEDDFQMVEAKEEVADEVLKNRIETVIYQEIVPKSKRIAQVWYAYAAAAIVIVALGIFSIGRHQSKLLIKDEILAANKGQHIDSAELNAPLLTLADGSVISLEERKSGLLTKEAGAEIRKVANGELSYNTSGQLTANNNLINKIFIPRGNTYKITLSDGTKVWLNAASSLSYPSSFSGTERKVELVGEAYFEVAKNEKMPFKVQIKHTEVEVLGTHFNISAYDDEEYIKTTLLEGSVRLSHLGVKKILIPGYQAITSEKSSNINLKEANIQQVIAWKKGYFLFKDNTIEEVMSQVARWYRLKVVYRDKVEGKLFGGIYDKSKKLEELLKGLELTGLVKFKIEEGDFLGERRLIVMD